MSPVKISFSIPGDDKCDVAVTGLTEGSWKVTVNGETVGEFNSSKDGGMIYFKNACGEVTAGVHGLNRLGGNGGTAAMVFGTIAGREAAFEVKR